MADFYNEKEEIFKKSLCEFANINISKLNSILKEKPISFLLEYPSKLGLSSEQVSKIEEFKKLLDIYNSVILPEQKIQLDSPETVFNLFKEELRYEKKEHFKTVLLDTKCQILSIDEVSIGSLNTSIVHPREVFKEAISSSASSILLVHNHPSGNPSPSKEDLSLTKRLVDAGNLLNITVLDHVIIGNGSFISMKQGNLVDFNNSYNPDKVVEENHLNYFLAPAKECWTGKMFSLYQAKKGEDYRDVRWRSLESLYNEGQIVDLLDYDLTYQDNFAEDETIEDIFFKFNIKKPKDFFGRSMSVSDILLIDTPQEQVALYCDSFGFVDISNSIENIETHNKPIIEPIQKEKKAKTINPPHFTLRK